MQLHSARIGNWNALGEQFIQSSLGGARTPLENAPFAEMPEESVVHLNADAVSAKKAETQLLVQHGFARDIASTDLFGIRTAPAPIGWGEYYVRSTQRDPRKDFNASILARRASAASKLIFTNFHAYIMHQMMHKNKLDQPAFGVALQRARQQLGMSQNDVATQVGLEQSTISRIEKCYVLQSSRAEELHAIIDRAATANDLEGVVEDVVRSPELRALVARILGAGMHR